MPKDDQLQTYREKRSAGHTPEPFGGSTTTASALAFVVQKHGARRMHYDLRLEFDGLLKSWAVPKGPSPNPSHKRLAVRTEDHPLEYLDFEDVIPDGNYGAGAMIVWDRGLWRPLKDPLEGLEKGKLLFELQGHKLRGRWTLVRTKRSDNEWLLIKEQDPLATDGATEDYPTDSVISGLTVEALKSGENKKEQILQLIEQANVPRRRKTRATPKPMLAKTSPPFSDPSWCFEIKYDGYRIIAEKEAGRVTLFSRNGNDLTATFPEIASAVATLPYERFIVDGEAVVHDQAGLPSFGALQKRGLLTRTLDVDRARKERPATYYLFDCLAFDDYDLRAAPLHRRKAALEMLLPSVGTLRYSEHLDKNGVQMFERCIEMGLEGIVAKRCNSAYVGRRSDDWLKIVGERRDEFAVLGFTRLRKNASALGALLLGQHDGHAFQFVGRVGSGFSDEERRVLFADLNAARNAEPPPLAPHDPSFVWKNCDLVIEAKFKERTADGLLRAPVYLGLRDDKPPEECTLPGSLPEPDVVHEKPERRVQFTNRDKVFWPEDGFKKSDLIGYYEKIGDWILPYLADRPLVLDRYPDGIEGKSFYQKDAPGHVPDWVRIETLWSEGTGREIRYFVIEDLESLLYVANSAAIPLHVWASRIGNLQRPDWCVLDLDPKGAPFADVITIARALHKLCEAIAVPNFVKTSGSTGLHVMIPMSGAATFEQARIFGELLARVILMQHQEIATIERIVSARQGRVYIDTLQNGHGRLIVAPFSVRPLPCAPVSMPLTWNQVTKRLDMTSYTIKTARSRMVKLKSDPLRAILSQAIDLSTALQRLQNFVNPEGHE
ncbi:MAG: DNA ligase D [Pseudomonadota bacterium]